MKVEVITMKYKVVDNNDEYWFASEDKDGFNGPAIAYFKNKDEKVIGVLKNNNFKSSLNIYNAVGTNYCFSVYNEKTQKEGPTLFVNNGFAYFGYYRSNVGFEGTVYVFKKNLNTKIQEYHNGLLVNEAECSFLFDDELFSIIPFHFSYSQKVKTKEFIGDNGSVSYMHLTGEPSTKEITLCAVESERYGSTIGAYCHTGYHGIVMKIIDNGNTLIFRKYKDGNKRDDFQLSYCRKVSGMSYVSKNSDGTYTDFVYLLENNKYCMKVGILNKNRKAVNGFKYLPNKIEEIGKYESSFSNNEKYYKSEEVLNELIGLANVKKQISRMKAYCLKNKSKEKLNLSMVFTGNPGTGKTEVARLIANILYENGILPSNKLVEVDRSGLVAEYIGQTEAKVNAVIGSAIGGVLFIDEAYSLFSGFDSDYGQKAIDILTKALEDNKGKICVIFAGYKEPMQRMVEMNCGFKSRINRWIDFEDYSLEELKQIALLMLKKSHYKMSDKTLNELMKIVDYQKDSKDFSNARTVRNILESLYEIQAERTLDDINNVTIIYDDIICYENENNIHFKNNKVVRRWDIETTWFIKNTQHIPYIFSKDYIEQRTVNLKADNGEGSGFFISPNGIIATAAHVVKGAKEIIVRANILTNDNQKITKDYLAEIIDLDEKNDVAIIGIIKKEMDYPYFSIEQEDYLPSIGEEIAMGGYPFGEKRLSEISINEGRVQCINKDSYLPDGYNDLLRIYLDMNGYPGNSGSPVINKHAGKVIGIFNGASIGSSKNMKHAINFAIPIKPLWDLLNKNQSN